MHEPPTDLTSTFGSLQLSTPFLGASGCFGYGNEFAHFLEPSCLGGIVTKGISLLPRVGNPPPRIFETSAGMLNSIGLANVGLRGFLDEKLEYLSSLNISVWVNFFGETFSDYVQLAEALGGASSRGVSALEMNISCPNVSKGGVEFGTSPETVYRLTRACAQVTDVPIIVKLTPNVTDIVAIADGAVKGGACGVTAINTVRGMAIDIRKRRPVLSTIYGGLSGPAIKPIGLAAVHRLYKAMPDVPICGVGGIWNAADAMEYVQAGASCVQVGTANFTKPDVLVEITNDFRDLLADLGFSSTSEAVGAAHQPARST